MIMNTKRYRMRRVGFDGVDAYVIEDTWAEVNGVANVFSESVYGDRARALALAERNRLNKEAEEAARKDGR
jgi:hypothetical protein